MDKQVYDFVKAALKEGKSLEDVVAEINAMAETAKKELEPKNPIADMYNVNTTTYTFNANHDGTFNREALVTAIAIYFVQNGFHPDECFENEGEFRNHIGGIIDCMLSASKTAEKCYVAQKSGADEAELMHTAYNLVSDVIGPILRDLINSWD